MSTDTPAERRRSRVRSALMDSALRRFELDGYDATTVADIADDADISTRTFFRYFADKEDVLFPNDRAAYEVAERTLVEELDGRSAPFEAMMTALDAVADALEASRERLQARARVIAATPALRGREQLKYLQWQDDLLPLVVERGTPPDETSLAMSVAFGLWREAYRRWLAASPPAPPLREHLEQVRIALGPLASSHGSRSKNQG